MDWTDFRTPGDLPTPGDLQTPLGGFGNAAGEADEQDKESASDVQRFIISDLSDIFISDIFMASIDWLGTYLLDLLGTLDFLSLVYFLSTFLVSTWLGTFLV